MDTVNPAPASGARSYRSQLFMVRVWLENLGADRAEWRGQVQDVASGQVRYFRDWQTLAAFLAEQSEKHTVLGKEEGEENSVTR